MADLNLNGRLGVEVLRDLQGCCIDSILAWRPQVIGQKNRCLFCSNPMKSVRAGEVNDDVWTGAILETRKDMVAPTLCFGEIWFSKRRFFDAQDALNWCFKRGLKVTKVEDRDENAFCLKIGEIFSDTARIIWAAPGVAAVVGVMKVDTADLSPGGLLAPSQGGEKEEEENNDDANEKDEDFAEFSLPLKSALDKFHNKLDSLLAASVVS